MERDSPFCAGPFDCAQVGSTALEYVESSLAPAGRLVVARRFNGGKAEENSKVPAGDG